MSENIKDPMQCLRTTYGWSERTKLLTVVIIIYFGGMPHSAVTVDERGYEKNWDIDIYGDDEQGIMIYSPGSGSLEIEVHAVMPESNAEVWIHPDYKNKVTIKTLINAKLIDTPYELTDGVNRSANPFEYCREVCDITYCQECDMCYDEDYCPIHDCEFTEGAEEEWKARCEYDDEESEEE